LILAVRLTFRKTERTFADAAAEIDEFFKDVSTSEPSEPSTKSTDAISTIHSKDVGEVTDAVSKLASVEPEQDNQDDSLTTPGTMVSSTEHRPHHAPPRGIVPPQIFQAMAESKATSPK